MKHLILLAFPTLFFIVVSCGGKVETTKTTATTMTMLPQQSIRWQPIPELHSGYRIHCGLESNNPTQIIAVEETTVSLHRVIQVDGKWFCSVSSFDNESESGRSEEVEVIRENGVFFAK